MKKYKITVKFLGITILTVTIEITDNRFSIDDGIFDELESNK